MFFNKFPNIEYDFEGRGETNVIKNIFRSVRALPEFLDEFRLPDLSLVIDDFGRS